MRAFFYASVAVLAMAIPARATPITYSITSIPGVSGQITTDGATGTIGPSDILSWNWLASGSGATSIGTDAAFSGQMIATSSALSLDFVSLPFPDETNSITLAETELFPGHGGYESVQLSVQTFQPTNVNYGGQWGVNVSISLGGYGPGQVFNLDASATQPASTFVVATAAPEPSAAILFASGLACVAWKRRR